MTKEFNEKGRGITGIIILDKSTGQSSNFVLQQVKRLFGASKAGHTGSLDPLATGLLPICLGEATKRKALILLNKAKKIGMVAGKDPMGIAAAALYLACNSTGGSKTQKEISIASGVTEVMIRNRCVGLKKLL